MKRKYKYIFLLLLCVLLSFFNVGCQKNGRKDAGLLIYYVNKQGTKIEPMKYEPVANTSDELVEELLAELMSQPEKVDYQMPFPDSIELEKYEIKNKRLYLYFNREYNNLDNVTEVLGRGAFVKTLCQIPSIDGVCFYVGVSLLTDENNKPIEMMTADTFIENPGEQINAISTVKVTLYFSNLKGTKLLKEVQQVLYNSNISMEKFVMERLLKGPMAEDKKATIPDGTKLINVSVLDGVCFVSLDSTFLDKSEVAEEVVIYSIVNSLVELSHVNKVQISVDGNSNLMYREKISLEDLFERDLDLIESKKKK